MVCRSLVEQFSKTYQKELINLPEYVKEISLSCNFAFDYIFENTQILFLLFLLLQGYSCFFSHRRSKWRGVYDGSHSNRSFHEVYGKRRQRPKYMWRECCCCLHGISSLVSNLQPWGLHDNRFPR